jgi:hypothetical protein
MIHKTFIFTGIHEFVPHCVNETTHRLVLAERPNEEAKNINRNHSLNNRQEDQVMLSFNRTTDKERNTLFFLRATMTLAFWQE